MKAVRDIRSSLEDIPGALLELPPEETYSGTDPGIRARGMYRSYPIWREEGEDTDDLPSAAALDSWFEEQEETEDQDATGEGAVPAFDPVIEIGADVDESFPALNGTEGEKIRQSVLLHGMDALGWYVSFHVTGLQWGVYIPVSGIAYLVREALGKLPVPLETKLHLAFHAILNHELFHFATDYAVAQSELVFNEPWWAPAKQVFRQRTPPYTVIEEQLANAYMLKAFRTMKSALRVRGKQEALKKFTLLQPEGYQDAVSVRPQDWDGYLAKLARQYGEHGLEGGINTHIWRKQSAYDWAAQFPIRPRVDWRHCPIHIVDDGDRLGIPKNWLNFFSRLESISETDKFRSKLVRLASPIQKAWTRTKEKLQTALTTGADFKKWPKGGPDIYSVRVNDNFRAHLQRSSQFGDWLAIEIGGHKEMGHG